MGLTDREKLQHAGHDLSAALADLQIFKDKVSSLMLDALDAVEIEEPQIAVRRLKAAIKLCSKPSGEKI